MRLRVPLTDVTVERSFIKKEVSEPVYTNETCQVNHHEFAMQVQGVGNFYACDGRIVKYNFESSADPDWVNLYLNGLVLVALLHQRRIINFHASSFIYNNRGIMILGETGAGKSSLTASFTLNGAGFLSDDLTPVIFREAKPYIWPLHREIKLRDNTVGQLNISRKKLREAEMGTGKRYLQVKSADVEDFALNTIVKIEIGKSQMTEFYEPSPADKFTLLRSEICSWEILAGMPETEAEYMKQLVKIIDKVHFVRVVRPEEIKIAELNEAVKQYLDGLTG